MEKDTFYVVTFQYKNNKYDFNFLKFGITNNFKRRIKQILSYLPIGTKILEEFIFDDYFISEPSIVEAKIKKHLNEIKEKDISFDILNIFPFPISKQGNKEMSSLDFLPEIANIIDCYEEEERQLYEKIKNESKYSFQPLFQF